MRWELIYSLEADDAVNSRSISLALTLHAVRHEVYKGGASKQIKRAAFQISTRFSSFFPSSTSQAHPQEFTDPSLLATTPPPALNVTTPTAPYAPLNVAPRYLLPPSLFHALYSGTLSLPPLTVCADYGPYPPPTLSKGPVYRRCRLHHPYHPFPLHYCTP